MWPLFVDACREGRASLWWLAPVGVVGVAALAPAVGGMALGARARTTLDVVLWVQWAVPMVLALQLGASIVGPDGLRRVILATAVPRGPFVVARLSGAAALLAVLVAVLTVASVPVEAARAAGAGMVLHAVSVWLEAGVWLGLTAAARTAGARGWLAAAAAATVALTGHLHGELVAAAATWGLEAVVAGALVVVPGLHRASVQGALITGVPVDRAALLWGWVHLLGWSLATMGLTVIGMSRREPV